MKLEKFLLFSLEVINQPPKEYYEVVIPKGSVFIKALIMNEGMYLFYQIPELKTDNKKTDIFKVILTGKSIPIRYEFIDIVSTVLETEKGDSVLVMFPLFRYI